MQKATLLPVIILVAVAVGGLLYLYGGPSFHQSYLPSDAASGPGSSQGGATVLAQGDEAAGMDGRVNYRITTPDQLAALWQMVYGQSGGPSVPNIDFNNNEVLALFDGSHSTGGYGIRLDSIKDKGGKRTVTITHVQPDDTCVPAGAATSPFVILEVSKSSLPISRIEQTATTPCQ